MEYFRIYKNDNTIAIPLLRLEKHKNLLYSFIYNIYNENSEAHLDYSVNAPHQWRQHNIIDVEKIESVHLWAFIRVVFEELEGVLR